MINEVKIKTKDCIDGIYDVFFDGMQVADKINTICLYMEAGKVSHMIMSAEFLNLEVDGIPMNVDIMKPEEKEISEDIQHVSYEPEQLGYGK